MRQRELEELFIELEEDEDGLLDATLDDERPVEPLLLAADEAELAGAFRAKLAFTPRPYQEDALAAWLAADGRGVVVLPTGAGKTVLALMAIERLALRTLVVVPTIELLAQWQRAVCEQLGLPGDTVGIVGGGRREVRNLTIITFDS